MTIVRQFRGQLSQEHLDALPVFPLPRVVFFPHTSLPLHVFEHRYRSMIQWCLDHEWPIAIPRVLPGHEEEQLGSPPVSNIAGVGRIVTQQALPDGRFNVVVEGLARVRLVEEHARRQPWREWRVEAIEDPPVGGREVEDLVVATRQCLAQLRERVPALRALLEGPTLKTDDARVLADRLGSLLFHSPVQRQDLLETTDAVERLKQITARLGRLLIGAIGEQDLIH